MEYETQLNFTAVDLSLRQAAQTTQIIPSRCRTRACSALFLNAILVIFSNSVSMSEDFSLTVALLPYLFKMKRKGR